MKISDYIKRNWTIVFLIAISILPLFDLLRPGLPLTHDGQDHVARIANFYQNLTEGNIIPRWAGNLNWGYGHPILEFLYPLPSYLASLFHFFGFTLVDSVKFVFGISFVLSAITMYFFVKELLSDEKTALLAGLLYVIAQYRFVDLYVRGAIGEHVAFIFPPLIFYFLLKLSQAYRHSGESRLGRLQNQTVKRFQNEERASGQARMTINYRFVVGGSFSLAGLILSHNAIMIMFLSIIFLYAIYIIWQSSFNKYLILNTLYILLLGFGLSSFFLLPAFFEGKYTLRDIVTSGGYVSNFIINFKDFVYGQWNYGGTGAFNVQIGLIHWLLIIIAIPMTYILFKKRNKLWIFSLGSLVIFFLSLFLMTPPSMFIWENITILQKFQFPWRFLSVTVFVSSVIGALVVHFLPSNLKMLGIYILILAVLFFNKDYWHAKGYLIKPESFFEGIYNGTTDTGESAPIWSVRFMEKRPKEHIQVINGNAVIKELSRKSTVHVYEIDAKERSRILENTLYFPGWNVSVDGRKADIEFQDPQHRGLMTFFVEKGKHNIEIKFGETKLRLFADIITVATLTVVIFYLAFGLKKNYNPRDEKDK